MIKVETSKAFRYWQNGCWPTDYAPGAHEVEHEVAKQMRAAGVLAESAESKAMPAAPDNKARKK